MSEGGYKMRNQSAIHFITFAVVEWVDVSVMSCKLITTNDHFFIIGRLRTTGGGRCGEKLAGQIFNMGLR